LIVIDASVVTDFLLGHAATHDALRGALAGREHEPLHAPELVDLETLNALRGLARRGAITDRRAMEAVSDLARLRLIRYPHAPLRERVWELRTALTAYDASYLALAEAVDGSLLMTADRGLATRARKSLGSGRVRRVG
jgi:predicted nucleic acid-binding protein